MSARGTPRAMVSSGTWDALPHELRVHVLAHLAEPTDVVRAGCACRELQALVEPALRARVEALGVAAPGVLPAGEASWTAWLCWLEQRERDRRASAPYTARVCANLSHSLVVLPRRAAAAAARAESAAAAAAAMAPDEPDASEAASPAEYTPPAAIVYAFGKGTGGRLGLGDVDARERPTPLASLSAAAGAPCVAVAAGDAFSLALDAAGVVYALGPGAAGPPAVHGELAGAADAAVPPPPVPRPLAALGGARVVAISAGHSHALAASADGHVWSWGDGACGKLGHGDELARAQPTRIEHWGCVLAAAARAAPSPNRVSGGGGGGGGALVGSPARPRAVVGAATEQIVAVAAGGLHSLFVSASGALWSCGFGGWGALGVGDACDRLRPTRVPGLGRAGARALAVAAGDAHSLVLATGAPAGERGGTRAARRARSTSLPAPLPGPAAAATQGTAPHSAAEPAKLSAASAPAAPAAAAAGGAGAAAPPARSPAAIPPSVSAQERAVASHGAAEAASSAAEWRRGGGAAAAGSPPSLAAPRGSGVAPPGAAGGSAGAGARCEGAGAAPPPLPARPPRGSTRCVLAFGNGWNGRLGLGDQEHRLSPARVRGLLGADGILPEGLLADADAADESGRGPDEGGRGAVPVAVAAGGAHSLVALSDGRLVSWGFGWSGQLGLGDETTRLAPSRLAPLPGGARAVSVAAGGVHSLALCADGSVYSWGSGLGGRLGRDAPSRCANLPARVRVPVAEPEAAGAAADGADVAPPAGAPVAMPMAGG